MSTTYQVIIRNGRIEWSTEPPPQMRSDQAIRAQIRLLEEDAADDPDRGTRMAQAMEKLAQMEDSGLPKDPDQWLRDERKDRPLSGHE